MTTRDLHDGRGDGLLPLESLDLARVGSFRELLRAMSRTAFSGRQLGTAFDVFLEMARDADTTVVLTLSGAMTVAKQGKIICDLIDRGLVQAVVATGALIAHGLTESIGLVHYQHNPLDSDEDLYEKGYNRIYDTLEMEANLNDVERLVRSVLRENKPEPLPVGQAFQPDRDDKRASEPAETPGQAGKPDLRVFWSSGRLCRALGKRLHELAEGPGILRSAFERNVPVFIPAFTDSEIGLDVSTWAMAEYIASTGKPANQLDRVDVMNALPPFNPFLDLQDYAKLIGETKQIGIFTVGGGVPRNWAQQVAPYYEISNFRLGTEWREPRFKYGVRICPEPVHWGGLSGCTYSEGVSWGKFVSPADGGRFAEVYADATVVLPILMKAVFEELDAN
jgi:deoxyhypusine synthase